MKKAILTIGLFTLVLASTSFAAPKNSIATISANTISTPIDGTGGQSTGDRRKTDYNGNGINASSMNTVASVDVSGSQLTGNNRKVD